LRFCSRCGREEGEIPIIRHLCIHCYLDYHRGGLLPPSIELIACPSCGSYRVGDRWIHPGDFGYDERIIIAYILENSMKIPEDVKKAEIEDLRVLRTEYGEIIEGRVALSIGDKAYRIYKSVRLSRERRLCPQCHKIRGKGYEAIVQIRGFPSMGEELKRKIEGFLESLPEILRGSIAEVESLREGIDLKVVSKHAAQGIANMVRREYGGSIKTSEEGEMRRRGSRLVIRVRIADLREGEYIRIGGSPYIVARVAEDGITLIDRNGKRISVSREELLRE
jgi:nonsense-mediated mRNA decay protein 3